MLADPSFVSSIRNNFSYLLNKEDILQKYIFSLLKIVSIF